MVLRPLAVTALTFALSTTVFAGTPGIFQGQVYRDQNAASGWIYVQSRNGMLRKVEISRARVVYSASVPASERAKNPRQDLAQGAEVRVTAEQDGDGEWRASQVEILKIGRKRPGQDRVRSRMGNALSLQVHTRPSAGSPDN